MADSNLTLNPSDIVGAIQRSLIEAHSYLGQPALSLDCNLLRQHLARAFEMLDVLESQQATIAASQGGENGEARAN